MSEPDEISTRDLRTLFIFGLVIGALLGIMGTMMAVT